MKKMLKIQSIIFFIFAFITIGIIAFFPKKFLMFYDLQQVYWNKNFPISYVDHENIINFEGRDGIYYDILTYKEDISESIIKEKLNGNFNNIPEHERTIKETNVEITLEKFSKLNLTDEESKVILDLSKKIRQMKNPIVFKGETITTKLFIIYNQDNFTLHLLKYHE